MAKWPAVVSGESLVVTPATPSQLVASRSMDNQRLILFIVFSFSLLLLWEAWQDKHAPPPSAVTATSVHERRAQAPRPRRVRH